jgi:hypothetical protein
MLSEAERLSLSLYENKKIGKSYLIFDAPEFAAVILSGFRSIPQGGESEACPPCSAVATPLRQRFQRNRAHRTDIHTGKTFLPGKP